MGHFLAIGIHHVLRCRRAYRERAQTSVIKSKSFALNNYREGSLRSADFHPMDA